MTQMKFWLWQPWQEIALDFAAPGVALEQTSEPVQPLYSLDSSVLLCHSFEHETVAHAEPLCHTAGFDHYCKLKEHPVLV